jgi:hypothetical protein
LISTKGPHGRPSEEQFGDPLPRGIQPQEGRTAAGHDRPEVRGPAADHHGNGSRELQLVGLRLQHFLARFSHRPAVDMRASLASRKWMCDRAMWGLHSWRRAGFPAGLSFARAEAGRETGSPTECRPHSGTSDELKGAIDGAGSDRAALLVARLPRVCEISGLVPPEFEQMDMHEMLVHFLILLRPVSYGL